MANPQKENGNTQIANEILGALFSARLNGTEWEIVMIIIRMTYGYHKKEDWISYTQFEKLTGKSRPSVWKAITSLVNKRLLVTNKKPGMTVYRLNKDYSLWLVKDSKLVNKKKSASYLLETQVVNNSEHTKETITKEIIQKKYIPRKDLNISLVDEGTKQKRKSSAKKKKEYELLGEFKNIKLTKEEQAILRQRHGSQETDNAIVEMSLWLKQNNKTYKDYYAALLNWIRRGKEKTNPTKVKPKCLTHEDL